MKNKRITWSDVCSAKELLTKYHHEEYQRLSYSLPLNKKISPLIDELISLNILKDFSSINHSGKGGIDWGVFTFDITCYLDQDKHERSCSILKELETLLLNNKDWTLIYQRRFDGLLTLVIALKEYLPMFQKGTDKMLDSQSSVKGRLGLS